MHLVGQPVKVVERIYDVDQPVQTWLQGIHASARRCFSGHIGAQVYTFQVDPRGAFRLEHMASDPGLESAFRRAHERAEPDTIRNIYLRRPVVNLARIMAGREGDPGYQEVVGSGIANIALALGVDPGGAGCALVFAQREGKPLSRAALQTLERLSAHLGSARRLRSGKAGPSRALDEREEAVLDVDGRVLHARRKAAETDARAALRAAARRVDRARMQRSGVAPEEALGLWRTLVDGRWSLVERFDSDGRRFYVARRNDPTARRVHCLGVKERKVVALLAIGHSIKLCAYELGLAQSTVSELASSAMRKLGVKNRAELVEIHGTIVGPTE